jgi:uncharacterized coiled-coil protein SlyX
MIYILIFVFVLLIGYQIISTFFQNKVIEGLENSSGEYQDYGNDPLILAKQNAGNIDVLKKRVDVLDGVNTRVNDMQININSMQQQIDGLVQQQSDLVSGAEPANISGTEPEQAPQ